MQQPSTQQQIVQLLSQMPEADRRRMLSFAQALIAQKTGKRQQRVKRLARPVGDSWRIGN